MKPRTSSQLQDFLDQEFAWRLKEIANLKNVINGTGSLEKKTLIRASLALLYAHWEGFIKASSFAFLFFIEHQGLKYNELQSCFSVLGLKGKLNSLKSSKQMDQNKEILEFIINELDQPAKLKFDGAIRTESNLNSEIFENISISIGINPAPYQTKYHLIDESLLKRRNGIAHGDYIDISGSDYKNLADEVLQLLRNFKTDIENSIILNAYKKSA
ncbi:MAE_28990/MAE_18760 family HEPN-like nuclease [Geothrix terrae]|uniref:MAE_28990/MAE_18760 family HEPN-like nuclease n=1 Tax=Geothrix terrae TaxID=2922720 RepID=UPI001FADD648|nr:MAE_28990/MAE_18760 family HEPN-like nuclease [Geothrix terrae]